MIPFAASAAEYSRFVAGSSFSTEGKNLARTRILSASGCEVLLSVPVTGGSHALKGRRRTDVMISQHGRWQDVHLGAWRAAYGRIPFFTHLFPEMERIYAEKSHGSLAEFNEAMHRLAVKWLGLPVSADAVRSALESNPERFKSVIGEYKRNLTPEISIFDAIFRYGKEAIFPLFAIIEEKVV